MGGLAVGADVLLVALDGAWAGERGALELKVGACERIAESD
jgi:hypothetical protein